MGGVVNNNNNTFTFGTSDNLTYTYTGNQLQKVSDAGNGGWSKGLDFRDGSNSGNDYTYDGNGNMISDQNKGVTLTFNQLNLPQAITKNSTNNLSITYDATGTKLKEVNNVNGKKDSTSYFNDILEEGKGKKRILFGDGYIIDKNDTLTDYFYEKDHLGNIRIVFAADSSLWNTYTLSMEPGHDSVGAGYGKFQNVDQFREAQEFYQGHFGARLSQQSGPFIELSAHNNDSLTARVYYYYLNSQAPQHPKTKDSLNHIPPFSVGITPVPQIANPDVHAKTPHAVLSLGFNLGGLFNRSRSTANNRNANAPQTLPNAYLDILLEDSSGNQLQEWKQTITQQGNQWYVLGDSFKVHIPDTTNKKYKFHISLVNEDNANVWFDTLRVAQAQTTGPIVQVNDYYPYGNLIDGIMYQAANPDTNMYRYNGKHWEEAFKLNLYDYNKRWFDPQIGRFIEIDRLSDSFPNLTNYQFASNNPIRFIDLDGLEATTPTILSNTVPKDATTVAKIPISDAQGTVISAKDANVGFKQAPYKEGSNVLEYKTPSSEKFVRVYSSGKNSPEGQWIMKTQSIEGKSPAQIKDEFSLPFEPTDEVEVNVPKNTTIRTGIAGKNGFGNGGGTQFQLMDKIPSESFTKSAPLPEIVEPAKLPEMELIPDIEPEPLLDPIDPILKP